MAEAVISENVSDVFIDASTGKRNPALSDYRVVDGVEESLCQRGDRLRAISTISDFLSSIGNNALNEAPRENDDSLKAPFFENDSSHAAATDDLSTLKKILNQLKDFNATYAERELQSHLSLATGKLYSEKTVKIGVFGRLKSGKSTLLNSIVHSSLFPTDSGSPETSFTVGVCHDSNMHEEKCSSDPYHGRGKLCPILEDESGKVLAQGSMEILQFIEIMNKNARTFVEGQKNFLIKANIPILSKVQFSECRVVLLDTPGFGEAYNKGIMKRAKEGISVSSAFVYLVDSSKLNDQLDVNTLSLIKDKDEDIFNDGRLLMVANHFDRVFHRQAKSGRHIACPLQVKDNMRKMAVNGIGVDVPSKNVICCIAYWGWYARVQEDVDEEEFEIWKKIYQKNVVQLPGQISETNPRRFVEDVSKMRIVESWLCTISKNAENLFMKSVVSDTLQCCRICLSRCMEFGNAHKSRFEFMTSQLLEKSSLWNDVVKILLYIDDELEMFKADLTEAYDEDIQAPINYMQETARQKIGMFEQMSISKCLQQNEGEAANEETPTSSEDEITDSSEEIEDEGMQNDDNTSYTLKNFKEDIQSFTEQLERELNLYLATVRFTAVPRAIPFQHFAENKATLDLCAYAFLSEIPSQRVSTQHADLVPGLSDIESVLVHRPLSLSQLREKTVLKELRLSWYGRIKVWFQEKFKRNAEQVKNRYQMRRSDVRSAIKYLVTNNCLIECSDYLKFTVKDQILQCYFNLFTTYVRGVLEEYETTKLMQMEDKSKQMEKELSAVLAAYHTNERRKEYLSSCVTILEQQKAKYNLNMEEFIGEEENEDNDLHFSTT